MNQKEEFFLEFAIKKKKIKSSNKIIKQFKILDTFLMESMDQVHYKEKHLLKIMKIKIYSIQVIKFISILNHNITFEF